MRDKGKQQCLICGKDIKNELPKRDAIGNRYCADCYLAKCRKEIKEKAIEEMAKSREYGINNECKLNNGKTCEGCEFDNKGDWHCQSLMIATHLYGEKYQKIDTNVVILTREEFEDLCARPHFHYIVDFNIGEASAAETILNKLYRTPREQIENEIKRFANFFDVEIKEN